MPILRSILFNVAFYLVLVGLMLASAFAFFLPRRTGFEIARHWTRILTWLLAHVAGTHSEIRGANRLPDGPFIVAAKHQSLWDTFALVPYLPDPAYIMKRELTWIPVFGWYMAKFDMIGVQRGARSAALKALSAEAGRAVAAGRQVLIFPEGTRRRPGDAPTYKYGVVHLYQALGVPCVPVALNSGLYWPRRSLMRHPGTIVAEFLEPIPPSLPPETFAALLRERIEQASDRLIAEAAASPSPPPPAREAVRRMEEREKRVATQSP